MDNGTHAFAGAADARDLERPSIQPIGNRPAGVRQAAGTGFPQSRYTRTGVQPSVKFPMAVPPLFIFANYLINWNCCGITM